MVKISSTHHVTKNGIPKRNPLVLYQRFDSRGQNKGFGWHTAEGKKDLESKGFRLVKSSDSDSFVKRMLNLPSSHSEDYTAQVTPKKGY